MVSKCSCCVRNPSNEDNNHLFLKSEIATQVLSKIAQLLQISINIASINQVLVILWEVQSISDFSSGFEGSPNYYFLAYMEGKK